MSRSHSIRIHLFLLTVCFLSAFVAVRAGDNGPGNDAVVPAKIQALLDSCEHLRLNAGGQDNFVRLRQTAEKGISLLARDEEKEKAQFFYYIAIGHYYQVNFDSAQYYFYRSLSTAQPLHATRLIIRACVALIPVNFQLQQPGKVDECKNILVSISDTTRDAALLQDIDYALGSYYQQKSYYSTAQDYFIKSLQLREKEVDSSSNPKKKFDYAIQCDMLSKLYLNTEMVEKSLAALRKAQRFASVSPNVDNRLLSSFVEAFTSSDRIDSALWYNGRLEANTRNTNLFPSELVSSDLNIALYYINKKQYPAALRFIDKADTVVNRIQSPMMTFQAQMVRGRYLEETGRYDQSIPLLTSAMGVASGFSKELYSNILKYLALDEKGKGNDKASLEYYQQYVELLDSITKEKASRTFADLETHYQASEKEARITSLGNENRIAALELKASAHQRQLLTGGLAALGIISLLLYFIYRDKAKLNRALNDKNERLDQLNHRLAAANETKARLFGILGHDLRAPVSKIVQLLEIQKQTPERLSETALRQHQDRLRNASENLLETMEDLLIWSKSQMERFTPQPVPVNIKKLVDREIAVIREQHETGTPPVELHIPGDLVIQTDENFLSVIVRNLLQNAIRHGENNAPVQIISSAGDLRIRNRVKASVSALLNEKTATRRVDSSVSGLGLQIAGDLAARLQGSLQFHEPAPQELEAVLTWRVETT